MLPTQSVGASIMYMHVLRTLLFACMVSLPLALYNCARNCARMSDMYMHYFMQQMQYVGR